MNAPALPQQPVDGATVTWWEIPLVFTEPIQAKAVYHVNTPWKVHAPDQPDGADIVDDWMVKEGSGYRYRLVGWGAIKLIDWEKRYATKEDALRVMRMRALKQIESLKREIAKLGETVECYQKELGD
jgi:hypothetical protein